MVSKPTTAQLETRMLSPGKLAFYLVFNTSATLMKGFLFYARRPREFPTPIRTKGVRVRLGKPVLLASRKLPKQTPERANGAVFGGGVATA
jgi:hypothetical protein